jgi:ABC-2 type transport system ATP-binding protein
MSDFAIRLRGVSKSFGTFRAVSALDLEIPRGSIYGLLGPNGSGKTTSIRMIMGILGPDEGTVTLFGDDPGETRRRRVGYLPEERGLYRKMKVLDHLIFLARIRGVDGKVARARALEWLERLGLLDRAGKRVEDLSKGMQQKVQFIGTVLHDPELLILDEPFSGLDPINQDVLESIVREFHAKGTTILFSTHLMEQAERMCERVALISHSRKVLDGEVATLRRNESQGTIALEFDGEGRWIDGPDLLSVERTPGKARVQVRPGAQPRDLLARAAASGELLRRFEIEEPRLHEIFVRHASKNRGDA